MKSYGTAAILVGGKSSRMGQDKKNLKLLGESLLQSIISQISPVFEEIIIVGCEDNEVSKIEGVDAVYPDALKISASLTGIYTALMHCKSEYVYVTACDMPNYDEAYIRYMMSLLERMPDKNGCLTRFKEWVEPFNAFYSRRLLSTMEAFLKKGQKSVFYFLSTEDVCYIEERDARKFSPDWKVFSNLNTPDDLETHLLGD